MGYFGDAIRRTANFTSHLLIRLPGVNVALGAGDYAIYDDTGKPSSFSGPVSVGNPTASGHAAPKAYVDAAVAGGNLNLGRSVVQASMNTVATVALDTFTIPQGALQPGDRVELEAVVIATANTNQKRFRMNWNGIPVCSYQWATVGTTAVLLRWYVDVIDAANVLIPCSQSVGVGESNQTFATDGVLAVNTASEITATLEGRLFTGGDVMKLLSWRARRVRF